MEKSRPHHNLNEIKSAFSDPENLGQMTGSARNGIRALNFADEEVANIVQRLSIREFYKSMTSLRDHTIWHDVYRPTHEGIGLYMRFTRDAENGESLLISFKVR